MNTPVKPVIQMKKVTYKIYMSFHKRTQKVYVHDISPYFIEESTPDWTISDVAAYVAERWNCPLFGMNCTNPFSDDPDEVYETPVCKMNSLGKVSVLIMDQYVPSDIEFRRGK